MRLTSRGLLQPKTLQRIDALDIETLEALALALERVATQIDSDDLGEDDLLGLLDKLDEPKPPSMIEVIERLDDADLRQLVEVAPTPTDKYLAQAELLTRSGQLGPPTTTSTWPVDYSKVYAWRERELMRYQQDKQYFEERKLFYGSGVEGCIAFCNHWLDTHDPRNAGLRDKNGAPLPVALPFILFERQEQLMRFVFACLDGEASGLVEKSRDMGATWVCVAIAIWMWLFWDKVTFGFGSATAVKLDRSGDAGSIFYKVREVARGLPACFRPPQLKPNRDLLDKRVHNPSNGSGIVGEVGDEVGRGSRTRIYVVDEAAHFEHPEAVTAALSATTRVRIDISSVSGLGTVFHRMRQGGKVWEPGEPIAVDRTNVFIMDWSHHPAKSRDWYDRTRAKYVADGLEHLFAQEIDRDYSASLIGVIIPKKWLEACVDAHLKIGDADEWFEGSWFGGQDVADGGHDTNAFVKRKGWVVTAVDQWGERDTGTTTRRMLKSARETTPITVYYDSIGVGSGVKAEANRLADEHLMPAGVNLVPWNAGAKVQFPGRNVIPDDEKSPKNKDQFKNLKAQGWFALRLRVYRTFKAVTENELSPIDEMISFDKSTIGPLLYKLIDELAQPTAQPDTRMKMVVDKVPEGASSPNLGDACMMCCFPLRDKASDDFISLGMPRAVHAKGGHCLKCGSEDVLANGNRYKCRVCGHTGDLDNALSRDMNTPYGGLGR